MLELQRATADIVAAHARTMPEEEVCGLVWRAPGGAEYVVQLRNMAQDKVKYYAIDAKELAQAYAVMDGWNGTPVAFYHSHPGGKSDPSEADMMGALNIGMHYLIAYPETVDLKAYDSPVPVRRVQQWELSAWECIDAQVLVMAELEIR